MGTRTPETCWTKKRLDRSVEKCQMTSVVVSLILTVDDLRNKKIYERQNAPKKCQLETDDFEVFEDPIAYVRNQNERDVTSRHPIKENGVVCCDIAIVCAWSERALRRAHAKGKSRLCWALAV